MKTRLKRFVRILKNTATADRCHSIRLQITPKRQWEYYSCTSAVLQMAAQHIVGVKLSHKEAGDLLEEDGIGELSDIQRVLKASKVPFKLRRPKTADQIRKAIEDGYIITAEECENYTVRHSIVILGYNDDGFWLVDPVFGICTWMDAKEVMRTCDNFTALKGA